MKEVALALLLAAAYVLVWLIWESNKRMVFTSHWGAEFELQWSENRTDKGVSSWLADQLLILGY